MTWEIVLLIVVIVVCATALAAWWLWIVHDSEPIDVKAEDL